MSDKTCGMCRWFDGDKLDESRNGYGTCYYDTPKWTSNGWQRPVVNVSARPCHQFERPFEKRWWEE